MTQTFTQNDLLRHLYFENNLKSGFLPNLPAAGKESISENFKDSGVLEEFREFSDVKSALNQCMMEPSADSVNFLMEYSRITARIQAGS